MKPNVTALERAFELAKSGQYASSTEIKAKLNREGYSSDQVTGATLMRQLRLAIAIARAK